MKVREFFEFSQLKKTIMKTRKIRVSNNVFGLPFVVHIPFDCNTPLKILYAVISHPLVKKGSYPIHDELWYDAINNR